MRRLLACSIAALLSLALVTACHTHPHPHDGDHHHHDDDHHHHDDDHHHHGDGDHHHHHHGDHDHGESARAPDERDVDDRVLAEDDELRALRADAERESENSKAPARVAWTPEDSSPRDRE